MQQDPSLHDEQLEDEIELVSELVLAASQTEGRLSEQAIDEVLGVDGPADAAPRRRIRNPRPGATRRPKPWAPPRCPAEEAARPAARGPGREAT